MGSEWLEPQIEHSSPGVCHKRYKPHWLVERLLRLREGQWDVWTLLVRSTHTLAFPRDRAERGLI